MSYTLAEILKDSDYKQSQFDLIQIAEFENRVTVKTDKNGKEIPYIQCLARKKEIRLTPEEAVRQLYLERWKMDDLIKNARVVYHSKISLTLQTKK